MESFWPTLLGAFLGVSTPFVINAFIDKRNYKRTLDTLFVQADTYAQGIRTTLNFIMQNANNKSWTNFKIDGNSLLKKNSEHSVNNVACKIICS